jgi:saccharopine dehydrogenase-like NADP-dependent oxidoreductase
MPINIEGKVIEYEGYPNRDSVPYMDLYGIKGAETMFRGTLRNLGWCNTLSKISDLGLLDEAPRDDLEGLTWAQLTRKLVGTAASGGDGELKADLATKLGVEPGAKVVSDLEWLGAFSDEPLPAGQKAPIDILCARMLEKMLYEPGERDMLILRHEFEAQYPDRAEKITSIMVDFGIPNGYTSMARTVGLPAAIAVRLIMEDKIDLTGVVAPVMPELYEPVLEELEALGIRFVEKWETIEKA